MTSNALVVVGAGPMGLAAAYHAVKAGFDVDVVEAGDRVGGMAAHFDFDGLSLERYYHFCCLSDDATLELLEELGMPDAMKWVSTTMGFFIDKKLYSWGDPISLLGHPRMNPIDKLRYGLMAFTSTKRSDWSRLDEISATDWITGWCGQKVYDRYWRRLLELKFYEFTERVSAAWIWQRMKRIGNSRRSLFEERLGYIEGGTEILMNALADAVTRGGGRIHLNTKITRILIDGMKTSGVEAEGGRTLSASHVISTAPTPVVVELLRDAPDNVRKPYEAIDNIGVICVIFKLKRAVTRHFWVNISDLSIPIPGVIEFSNLRPTGDHIVYAPYYMPQSNPRFREADQVFLDETFACLRALNPELSSDDILATQVSRLRYAQPVCDVGFAGKIPSTITPIGGLQIADTCFYYPEDRGVSESVKLAKAMVDAIPQDGADTGAIENAVVAGAHD